MDEAGAHYNDTAIPLQLNLSYVNVAHDACFRWLQRKYSNIKPVVETPHADSKRKKLHVDSTLLQRLENDVVACDELRWRAFSFPSHPLSPLPASYRHAPVRKAGTPATTVELHHTHQHPSNEANGIAPGRKDHYTLVINTREENDAMRRLKSKREPEDGSAAAAGATSVAPVPRVEELLERAVREEKQAHWCRILCEEIVGHEAPRTSNWAARWIPRNWQPLLGGYVSAPSRVDQARFLIFPQSGHLNVDARDPRALSYTGGRNPDSPQSVPYYVRGNAHWVVEESNPAAGAGAPTKANHSQPSNAVVTRGGLHHTLTYARIKSAPPSGQRSWADVVELSTAYQQARTERQYAPERAKVQRVTLLEDSVAVKTSQGNPRHSTLISATHATVLHSGVAHQRALSTTSTSKAHSQNAEPSTIADDAVLQLRLDDVYDSSVQHFALPGILQRWWRPVATTASTIESGQVTGSHSLEGAPRGLYRMRWSGGPGVELCQVSGGSDGTNSATSPPAPSSLLTVFGKFWSESWVQVPLSSRWMLTLRNQTALVIPLEPNVTVSPPVVTTEKTGAGPVNTASCVSDENSSRLGRVCMHPYFWATQGPRWDATLVRGFKNDYNGLHHARRWYSILSAELTLEGGKQTDSGRCGKKSRGNAAPQPQEHCSTDGARKNGAEMAERHPEDLTSAAGNWWRRGGTSLTAFANACMADTLRGYPRASVGFSFVSRMPRLTITPFNEIIPHKFECSLNWLADFKRNTGESESGKDEQGSAGFGLQLQSGLSKAGPSAASPTTKADDMPFLRVSPVETFQHFKCGLTWRFDD
ncbi:hypothetical protein JKF63_03797 [Porcisia hertigi]|uniref:Uncharacterized protein n=1 Tax=Porcisia hertigi TaxID=2761500 RepID=A0A836ILU7_9TRYP|nr:hypothetical protein JKF63_03797 [Porcisia hertigi]